jgi:hypothetical protein
LTFIFTTAKRFKRSLDLLIETDRTQWQTMNGELENTVVKQGVAYYTPPKDGDCVSAESPLAGRELDDFPQRFFAPIIQRKLHFPALALPATPCRSLACICVDIAADERLQAHHSPSASFLLFPF